MLHIHRYAPICALILILTTANSASGDTSYLLVKGPFGSLGEVETFKWKVIYTPGQPLATGQDFLNTVFGTPVPLGTYGSSGPPYLTSSNGTSLGAGYINFGNTANPFLFAESFTVGGIKVAQPADYSKTWSYFNAGGTFYGAGGVIYPAGNWTYAESGPGDRLLNNNSFDAFYFDQNDVPTDYLPLVSNFTDAIVIDLTSVPEPGRVLLLLIGSAGMVMRRRRPAQFPE